MRPRLHAGSVIAITVMFMSFLLIGIVGAAYLLSSHLRLTSLGADYLQATYNAESSLELTLYELKHRREGYQRAPKDLVWHEDGVPALQNRGDTMRSEISYRIGTEPLEDIPLLGGSRKFALYYEDEAGTIHNIQDMSGLLIELGGSTNQAGTTGDCLGVRLVGKDESTGGFTSITSSLPCTANSLTSLTSLLDPDPRTPSHPLDQDYPFSKFIQEHTEVLLLVNDNTLNNSATLHMKVRGVTASQTIASPKKTVAAEGVFGGSTIRKGIELWQDQLPDLLSRSFVQ